MIVKLSKLLLYGADLDYFGKIHDMKPCVVFTSTYQTEAFMVQSLLEANGILAKVLDDNTVSIMPLYSMAIGGVKVVVDENDKEEALRLIETDYSPEMEDPNPPD